MDYGIKQLSETIKDLVKYEQIYCDHLVGSEPSHGREKLKLCMHRTQGVLQNGDRSLSGSSLINTVKIIQSSACWFWGNIKHLNCHK